MAFQLNGSKNHLGVPLAEQMVGSEAMPQKSKESQQWWCITAPLQHSLIWGFFGSMPGDGNIFRHACISPLLKIDAFWESYCRGMAWKDVGRLAADLQIAVEKAVGFCWLGNSQPKKIAEGQLFG